MSSARRSVVLFSVSTLLMGCPIFDDHHDTHWSPWETPAECISSNDCPTNYTCGDDNACHSGDCSFWGCAVGVCLEVDGVPVCTWGHSGAGGGEAGGPSDGGGGASQGGAPPAADCTGPSECTDGQTCNASGECVATCENGCVYCTADAQCNFKGGEASTCVNGACVLQTALCFDATQCPSGTDCLNGKCAKPCLHGTDCSVGYLCGAHGFCERLSAQCETTADCGATGLHCVASACVPVAVEGTCGAGFANLDGGCILDEARIAECTVTGAQDACAAGELCLGGTCFVDCQSDPLVCAPPGGCVSITLEASQYAACGTFGDDCNPANPDEPTACKSGLCANGHCLPEPN